MTYQNEDRFEGSWDNGQKNGKGKYKLINCRYFYSVGSVYEGNWQND